VVSRRACRRRPCRVQVAMSSTTAASQGGTKAVHASTVKLVKAQTSVVWAGSSRSRSMRGASFRERHRIAQIVMNSILVQRRRDKRAAKKFFHKLLKGLAYVPRVIITDKLKSYGAAKREILPGVEHRQHRYLNNRAENSHQPTRQRERRMQGFKSPGHAQRFLSAYGPIAQHFRPRRHRLSAHDYRREMAQRFQSWREVTSMAIAA
jgi:putative transposase